VNVLAPAHMDRSFTWDAVKARHLLERAGFGLPPSAAQRLASMSLTEAVNALVDYERYPQNMVEPDWLPEIPDPREERKKLAALSAEARQQMRRERQRQEREALLRLQGWWVDRMLRTERPLEEKMTLFWHGHFAVSAQKVRSTRLHYELNQIFRTHATGNFGHLVRAVGKSPAMLEYLDNRLNRKGHPNENWARELFELFTLGIGHYTENDIKEAARAFTGWTARGGSFVYDARQHDDGEKVIFGRVGRFDGDQVIDLVLQQPACAEFICRKLWVFFVSENPDPEAVKELAKTFRDSGYELKPVLRQMFMSRAFYSPEVMGSQIKSPAFFVTNAVGKLGVNPDERMPLVLLAMKAMGQELFVPPNVKGWEGGRAWISTNSLLTRSSFTGYLVAGVSPSFGGEGKARLKTLSSPPPSSASPFASPMMSDTPSMMSQDVLGSSDSMPLRDEDVREFLLALAEDNRSSRQRFRTWFNASEFFAPYESWSVEQVVDTLAAYFLSVPLKRSRRNILLEALCEKVARKDKPLLLRDIPEDNRRGMLYLLLSSAEYQLC